MVLSEVVSLVQERILNDSQAPVFSLKDLRKLSHDRLKFPVASENITGNMNLTRLKQELLGEIPGLLEQRNCKCVVLTIEDAFLKALVECSQNTLKDDGFTLSKAAMTVRRFLFAKYEVFYGNLSKEKQNSSVALPLLNLVSLILDKESRFADISTNAESFVVNLAQLLRLNAVKTKKPLDGFVRYSKTKQPPLPVKVGLTALSKTRNKPLVEKLANEGLSVSYKQVEETESLIAK